jgi:hypothetical protein
MRTRPSKAMIRWWKGLLSWRHAYLRKRVRICFQTVFRAKQSRRLTRRHALGFHYGVLKPRKILLRGKIVVLLLLSSRIVYLYFDISLEYTTTSTYRIIDYNECYVPMLRSGRLMFRSVGPGSGLGQPMTKKSLHELI